MLKSKLSKKTFKIDWAVSILVTVLSQSYHSIFPLFSLLNKLYRFFNQEDINIPQSLSFSGHHRFDKFTSIFSKFIFTHKFFNSFFSLLLFNKYSFQSSKVSKFTFSVFNSPTT
jgi:hypothetical protein